MGFSRQEYWSGLPFPSPGDLPHPEMKPGFPTLQADSLPSEPPRKPQVRMRSKSEREKQIPCINTYIWNLEKRYRWSCLQGRNRDADRENGCVRGRGVGWTGRLRQMHIHTTLWKIASGKQLYSTGSLASCSVVTYMGGKGWERRSRGSGEIYTADSLNSIAEMNTIL